MRVRRPAHARSVRDALAQVEAPFQRVLLDLVTAAEASNPYTRGHSARVALLAMLIGEDLGLSHVEVQTLKFSAFLHDVGMIGIPTVLLSKREPLTVKDFEQIKQHPLLGEAVVRRIPIKAPVLSGVRSHHERWDGTGYPDGLSGTTIPLYGRVIAVVETYDTMTSPRPYRPALQDSEVLGYLTEGRRTLFDPDVVNAFLKILERYARPRIIS